MVRSRGRGPRRGQTADGTRVALAEVKPAARAVSLRQQLANLTPEVGRKTEGMARASSCLLADAGNTSESFNAIGTYSQIFLPCGVLYNPKNVAITRVFALCLALICKSY